MNPQNPTSKPALNPGLLLLSLTSLLLFLTGYKAYTTDHQTQVPMFLKQLQPDLFERDWFFSGTGQFVVRRFFINWEMIIYRLLPSVEWMLFAQHFFCFFVAVLAVWWTCHLLKRNNWHAALWIFALGGLNAYAMLAMTLVLDDTMVPRLYAYVACMLAVPLILRGWHFLAGLLMGLAGLMHGAPTLQFMPIAVLWIFVLRGPRRGLVPAVAMASAFAFSFWPQIIFAKELVQTRVFEPKEMIHWLAYVRHPHHMLPLLFDDESYSELLTAMLFLWAMVRSKKIDGESHKILSLLALTIAFLLVSVVFIHIVPVPSWIAFQPMRMFALLRYFLLFFVALHICQLAEGKDPLAHLRIFLIAIAIANAQRHPAQMQGIFVIEAILIFCAGRLGHRKLWRFAAVLTLVGVLTWLEENKLRFAVLLMVWAAVVFHRPAWKAWWRSLPSQKILQRNYAPVLILLNLAFLGALLCLPFKAWNRDPSTWSELNELHYEFATKYTVYPFPIAAIEFAGKWARENSSQNALFLIPPERNTESFHIWSLRAAVFNNKLFPYVQDQWPQWIERYYAHAGISNPMDSDAQLLFNDAGGNWVGLFYRTLTSQQILDLANRYNADYVITPCEALTRSEKLITRAGPFHSLRDRRRSKPREDRLWILEVPKPDRTS